uniref:DUF433 domain-containing protein n=1 Tax=Cyanothece sp. (strain PCC 7425 / ATCC 29141) TaxID=395961 RepID=B8HNH8_CYAP4
MQLEDYFDFLSPTDIRIKGHRIGIDTVLVYYLEGYTPEEIAANLPSLSLEKIHATLTYYLHHRPQIDAYLAHLEAWREEQFQAGKRKASPVAERLRAMKAEQQGIAAG